MDNKIANYHHSHDLQRTLQDMDSKITKILMDSGADSMIPNIANKESAFHYCGQSGNAAVRKQQCFDLSWEKDVWFWDPVAPLQVVKEIIKFLHAGQIQLVVNKQSGWVSFFCTSWRNFFCYSQLFPGRKDSCFLGLFLPHTLRCQSNWAEV